MKWYIQLLGGSPGDLSLSVLVHFDKRRYLFNCGESLQRYLTEAKARPSKLRNVFLSRLDWDTFGGFPGTSLEQSWCTILNAFQAYV
jgi:ribonuclease Z